MNKVWQVSGNEHDKWAQVNDPALLLMNELVRQVSKNKYLVNTTSQIAHIRREAIKQICSKFRSFASKLLHGWNQNISE